MLFTRLFPAPVLFVSAVYAQQFEIGGNIGYGAYRNGSIYAPGGKAEAGVRNRFATGAVIGEDLYQHISGEIRYLYQDGHPFLTAAGVKTDMQGQSHTVTYDLLVHARSRRERVRPFFAAGAGVKNYVAAGPAPFPQPIPAVATLVSRNQWKFVTSLGGGVKVRVQRHVILRGDFRDDMTGFPQHQIVPAANGTGRGIFQQFTGLFGASLSF